MEPDQMHHIMIRATETFGIPKQCIKTIEEFSELQKALCKYLLEYREDHQTAIPEIIEEIADVSLMLDQLQVAFGIAKHVQQIKTEKLERIATKINEIKKSDIQ